MNSRIYPDLFITLLPHLQPLQTYRIQFLSNLCHFLRNTL